MSTKVYTNAEINAALRAALDEKGEDYVYQPEMSGACLYKDAGGPSCLVGHVLHKLDPEMFEKVAAFERNPSTRRDTQFDLVAERLRLPFHEDQVQALRETQEAQDSGHTWGYAVGQWISILGEQL